MEAELRHKLFPPNAWMKVLHFNFLTSCPKDELHRWLSDFTEWAGVGSIPANPDARNVPSFRRWRLEMKLSPFFFIGLYGQHGNTTYSIPHKYAPRQKQAFEYGCADGSDQGSRRGSHVYEINTWLWNFGRSRPRIGGLSVAKTEMIRRQSRSETSRRAAETEKARKRAVDQI
jgi:hypothetical protein